MASFIICGSPNARIADIGTTIGYSIPIALQLDPVLNEMIAATMNTVAGNKLGGNGELTTRELRKSFNLKGVPIRIVFKKK